jgi:hypothetical protein
MRRKGGLCAAFCLSLSDGVDDSSAFGYRIHVNSHVYSVNGPDLASWSRESNLSLASLSIYVHCVATRIRCTETLRHCRQSSSTSDEPVGDGFIIGSRVSFSPVEECDMPLLTAHLC